MEISFIHPSIGFLVLALLVPFVPKDLWLNKAFRGTLAIVAPLIALASVLTMVPDTSFMVIPYLDQALELGRVDKLSIIFGQVFAIIAVIGTIYGMHVEDKGHYICGSLYEIGRAHV